jgi:large conductance mechanosensitive channel
MSMMKEFREFAMKGNVVDLAVGVIIGGAFGKIVSSLVSDVLMPIFGIVLGQVDFSALSVTIGSSVITYGAFIQSIVDFIIVSFCIFFIIKQMNRFKREKPVEPAAMSDEVRLLTEIRDALRTK